MLRLSIVALALTGCDPDPCSDCDTDQVDTGSCGPASEWTLLGSTLVDGDTDVPLDATVAVQLRSAPECKTARWRLVDDDAAEVASADVEDQLGSAVWTLPLPVMEPDTTYSLIISEVDHASWVFTTGTSATSERGLVPTLSGVALSSFESTSGDRLNVEATVTATPSAEVTHPAVQLDSATTGDAAVDIVWIVDDGGSAATSGQWADTGPDSRCVRARQLTADGSWGPWSEETCVTPTLRVGCATGLGPVTPLVLLLLPCSIRRRRARRASPGPSTTS